jgi:hypothetical protein
MDKNRPSWRVHCRCVGMAGTITLLTSGCIGGHEYKQMDAQHASSLDNYDLCRGFTYFKTETIEQEVNRRKLDCRRYASMGAALDQRAAQPGGGAGLANNDAARPAAAAKVSPAAGNSSSPAKMTCPDLKYTNLTRDQAKALQFVIEQQKKFNGVACLTDIVANDKFLLRGQTVVKYTATISFPAGYKTECFGVTSDKFTGGVTG